MKKKSGDTMKLTAGQLREVIARELGRLDESPKGFAGFGFVGTGGRSGPEIDGFGGQIARRQINEEETDKIITREPRHHARGWIDKEDASKYDARWAYYELFELHRNLQRIIDVSQETGALMDDETIELEDVEDVVKNIVELVRKRVYK